MGERLAWGGEGKETVSSEEGEGGREAVRRGKGYRKTYLHYSQSLGFFPHSI